MTQSANIDLLAARIAVETKAKGPQSSLYFPGTAGFYVTTPDIAALDIVGDLTLIADIAPADLTPAAATVIGGKATTAAVSYYLQIGSTGLLGLVFTTDGSTFIAKSSTVSLGSVGYVDGQRLQVAATIDVNNGAAGYDVRLWHRASNLNAWSQLGATVTTGTATAIFSGSSVVEVGSRNAGTSSNFTGRIYQFSIYTGIGASGAVGGTLVADLRGDRAMPYTDSTGKVWTATGAVSQFDRSAAAGGGGASTAYVDAGDLVVHDYVDSSSASMTSYVDSNLALTLSIAVGLAARCQLPG